MLVLSAPATSADTASCLQSLLGSGSGGITGQGVSLMAASLPSVLLLLLPDELWVCTVKQAVRSLSIFHVHPVLCTASMQFMMLSMDHP